MPMSLCWRIKQAKACNWILKTARHWSWVLHFMSRDINRCNRYTSHNKYTIIPFLKKAGFDVLHSTSMMLFSSCRQVLAGLAIHQSISASRWVMQYKLHSTALFQFSLPPGSDITACVSYGHCAWHMHHLRRLISAITVMGIGVSLCSRYVKLILQSSALRSSGLELQAFASLVTQHKLLWTLVTFSFATVQENYQGALDVLLLAEEAFDVCSPAHLEKVDNVGLLMIDISW